MASHGGGLGRQHGGELAREPAHGGVEKVVRAELGYAAARKDLVARPAGCRGSVTAGGRLKRASLVIAAFYDEAAQCTRTQQRREPVAGIVYVVAEQRCTDNFGAVLQGKRGASITNDQVSSYDQTTGSHWAVDRRTGAEGKATLSVLNTGSVSTHTSSDRSMTVA